MQAQVHALADFARQAFDDVEDHVRPVVRRYISLPVQKKIMNDCWDYGRPEEWFQVRRKREGLHVHDALLLLEVHAFVPDVSPDH